jgi:hypothetical protein
MDVEIQLLELVYTGWFVRVLGLQLYTIFLSVFASLPEPRSFRTRPLVADSCVLLPVTLNATLFGVLLLTSRAAADKW